MSRRFLTDIELLGFALLNARIHPVSADPSGLGVGDAGRAWYNTTTNRLMYWDGTVAVDVRDRARHTGTQLAATISDLGSAVQATRLDQFAAPIADVGLGGRKLTSLADGTAGTDAATFGQLLQFLNNQSFKAPVRAASTVNLTLSGLQTVDVVALAAGDRVLVKDQTAAATNGIYVVAAGAWVRSADFDSTAEAIPGTVISVQEGTVGGDKLFLLATNGPITLGTTTLLFSPYGASSGEVGVAGAGLTKTGSTYDVGAGAGISVSADSVAVDTTIVARKVSGTIPTATGGIFTVTGSTVIINHNLGNPTPLVVVRFGSAGINPGQLVEVDDDSDNNANNVTLGLPAAPAANTYVFSVFG